MLLRGDVLFVGCPVVCAVLPDVQVGQFFHQFLAGLAAAHESPHLADEHAPELPFKLRLLYRREPLPEYRQDNENTDFQCRVNISNPAATHRRLPNQLLVPGSAPRQV